MISERDRCCYCGGYNACDINPKTQEDKNEQQWHKISHAAHKAFHENIRDDIYYPRIMSFDECEVVKDIYHNYMPKGTTEQKFEYRMAIYYAWWSRRMRGYISGMVPNSVGETLRVALQHMPNFVEYALIMSLHDSDLNCTDECKTKFIKWARKHKTTKGKLPKHVIHRGEVNLIISGR